MHKADPSFYMCSNK